MPPETRLGLGIDLGSSGLRLCLIDADRQHPYAIDAPEPVWQDAIPYPGPFADPCSWRDGLIALYRRLPTELCSRIGAIALDGTSGTLLLCRPDGSLLDGPLALALPYHLACPEQHLAASALADADAAPASAAAASASSSLARGLRLLAMAGPGTWLLRHQADWLLGALLGSWRWGEATNNLRLGWLQDCGRWAGSIGLQPWSCSLPEVIECGSVLGPVDRSPGGLAATLDLPPGCQVVAGCTDASAAVLASGAGPGDGITVLGTTLVLKQWVNQPITAAGVSCQRLDGRWLVGGASNAGGNVLRQFFSDEQLAALSRQIDLHRPSGLQLRPLPAVGERFPVDDPGLEPVLEPRPVSDALYLQALLEGLSAIEAAGWQRLRDLGASPLQRVITLGGGARNPQWRALRQQLLQVPVLNRPKLSAALGMARLAANALHRQTHDRTETPDPGA